MGTGIVDFRQIREGSCFLMVLGVMRPEMAMNFGSKEVELMLDEEVVHGQPTD